MSTKLRDASQNFRLLYQKARNEGLVPFFSGVASLLCMMLPGETFEEVYRWAAGSPLLRRWLGDRKARKLIEEGFSAKLEPFESTLVVLRDDVMFDRLGGYAITIRNMALEVKLLAWREAIKVIADGFSGTAYGNCFDGYPLFSTSHTTGSNKGTKMLSATALADAFLAMRSQKDPHTGDNLLIEPTHLWFHIDQGDRATDILDKDFVLDKTGMATESNKWKNKLKPVPLQGLPAASSKHWGLLSLDPAFEEKPILHRYMPSSDKFVALDKDTDEANFQRRELKYGVEYWACSKPGFPQFIYGSDGTT